MWHVIISSHPIKQTVACSLFSPNLLSSRMSVVFETLSVQNTEAETEAAKFGEDVKYLAGRPQLG
jgi:hypothetical protein